MAGRPPIGKTAMTGAERQRRYLLKHKPVAKPKVGDATIATLQQALAAAKARIPLPPDEAYERQIKGFKTRIRNLMSERDAAFHLVEGAIAAGGMPRETRIAIDKALQPDQRVHATKAENDEACDKACRLWNAWKNSNDKARRKAR